MLRSLLAFGLFAVIALPVVAQDYSKLEVGAAYSYIRANTTFKDQFVSPAVSSSQNANLQGGKGELVYNATKTIGLVADFGGYEMLENRPADDLNVGRLVAEQGWEVKLLPYVVKTVADFKSLKDLLHKRVRWMTVMRLMRRQGHRGLIFTWGLIWALIAIAVHPTWPVVAGYLGAYIVLRVIMTWLIGIHGMKQKGLWPKMLLIPIWDAMAFLIWVASFGRNVIRWRGYDYYLRNGMLVPVNAAKTPRGEVTSVEFRTRQGGTIVAEDVSPGSEGSN